MSMIVAALLAQSQILSASDRQLLDVEAQLTELRADARPKPSRQVHRASARGSVRDDLQAVTTICAAAVEAGDTDGFVDRLAWAFRLDKPEAAELRSRCRIYALGVEDARRAEARRSTGRR